MYIHFEIKKIIRYGSEGVKEIVKLPSLKVLQLSIDYGN
jgi:hypothetical protein